jgi:hypothetical protein
MSFPLSFLDFSLWLAVTALVLLITSEMLSPYSGKINIHIERKKLRNVAFAMSILFLATTAIRIISIVLTRTVLTP